MLNAMEALPASLPQAPDKPNLISYDSSAECSLAHWMELHLLVDQEYQPPEFEYELEWEEATEEFALSAES